MTVALARGFFESVTTSQDKVGLYAQDGEFPDMNEYRWVYEEIGWPKWPLEWQLVCAGKEIGHAGTFRVRRW